MQTLTPGQVAGLGNGIRRRRPTNPNTSNFSRINNTRRRTTSLHQPPCKVEEDRHDVEITAPAPAPAPDFSMTVTWPMGQIPMEIFELIISYLTRAEVKKLRLVCRDFEAKVSAQYFRNVVVPFRSELYNSLCRDGGSDLAQKPQSLFSNGMRIFEDFGPHVLRFALSLELDEHSLAYPPVKPTQEAVPAFWGVYRWPHATYHRYTNIEGLERTADETEGMMGALRCLTKVTNMGLCCDAGLGFLIGPDTLTEHATARHPVFATQDWRQNHRATHNIKDSQITFADFNGVLGGSKPWTSTRDTFKHKILETMASDAGYSPTEFEEAIQTLLDSEGTTLSRIDFDERMVVTMNGVRERSVRIPAPDADVDGGSDGDASAGDRIDTDIVITANPAQHPLIPTNLTRAQKELLLELEWAHRAMIQSYVIALVDNSQLGCYNNLTTFTIAKIPSCHLHILCRDDFWDSIPSLKNVSLGVIADWRRISKPGPGFLQDTHVSPVESVAKAFKLLNDYIGHRSNIESVRFEWICGGEFAPSQNQRNQYILPAPFFEHPELMASPMSNESDIEKLICLPYIKHLSFKNCWASPHVFLHSIRMMALSSLEKLELETVSLSGPPTPSTHTPLAHPAFPNFQATNLAAVTNVQATNTFTVSMTPNLEGETLQQPEWMSWTGIIEHFSPGPKIKRLLGEPAERSGQSGDPPEPAPIPYLGDVKKLLEDEDSYRLKCISFRSCGYVSVDRHFLNVRAVLPTEPSTLLSVNGSVGRVDMTAFMQSCKGRLMARISPYINPQELYALQNVFSMQIGWETSNEVTGVSDNVEKPGYGRFSGIIEPTSTNSWIENFGSGGDENMDMATTPTAFAPAF